MQIIVHSPCSFYTAGYGADDERSTIGSVATDENVSGIGRVLGLEEAHSKENELSLDDLRLAGLDHQRPTAFGVRLPVDRLDADGGNAIIFS